MTCKIEGRGFPWYMVTDAREKMGDVLIGWVFDGNILIETYYIYTYLVVQSMHSSDPALMKNHGFPEYLPWMPSWRWSTSYWKARDVQPQPASYETGVYQLSEFLGTSQGP